MLKCTQLIWNAQNNLQALEKIQSILIVGWSSIYSKTLNFVRNKAVSLNLRLLLFIAQYIQGKCGKSDQQIKTTLLLNIKDIYPFQFLLQKPQIPLSKCEISIWKSIIFLAVINLEISVGVVSRGCYDAGSGEIRWTNFTSTTNQ